MQYENPSPTSATASSARSRRVQHPRWLNATCARAPTSIASTSISSSRPATSTTPTRRTPARSRLNDYRNENNPDFLVTANRELDVKVDFRRHVRREPPRETLNTKAQSTTGISGPGIYNVSERRDHADARAERLAPASVNSVFGSAAFTLTTAGGPVEGTARNDWSSTLPKGNNSYLYPSVNLSFVLTDAIPALRSNTLSFAKIRGSIARVGTDADPYQLRRSTTGLEQVRRALPLFALGNTIANAELKPEITTSNEGGRSSSASSTAASARRDVLREVDAESDPQPHVARRRSGFATMAINAGRSQNKGAEALLIGACRFARERLRVDHDLQLRARTEQGR